MPAYIFVNIDVRDPERYAEYIRQAPASIERFGGVYVVRGGRTEKLEGETEPRRVVLLRFDTYEQAKAWWASEDYAGAKALRQGVSKADMILMEGM